MHTLRYICATRLLLWRGLWFFIERLMQGYLSLVLHAHLPFVRHPEAETFLEENWLYEAITETYIPLLEVMERWVRDGMDTRLTLTLSPTLCSMLLDPLLRERYRRYLDGLIDLAEKETHRTLWDPALNPLAHMYFERLQSVRATYLGHESNLVDAFRALQDLGKLEIITCAATHAVLPLLANHPASVRAQILVARDHYRQCFGCDPRGCWLPECAYAEGVDEALREAGIQWFIVDTHGILYATPRPRYGVFSPLLLPSGVAAFGRDLDSARQVWSRNEGYPGDPRYRDFYRDIGFDLDYEYLRIHMPAPPHRSFTGIKYYSITGSGSSKRPYDRKAAVQAAADHAGHFLGARIDQVLKLSAVMDRPPHLVTPYDAELFGHWWYEGPEFLDFVVRKLVYDQRVIALATPSDYLRENPTLQLGNPSPSSWGEEGYWKVWLNETNAWIYQHLVVAQDRMSELARRFPSSSGLDERALKQAARELLLAQSSDWPFILRTETSPDYARDRVTAHLLRFQKIYEQLCSGRIDESWLKQIEGMDNLFPDVNYRYWG